MKSVIYSIVALAVLGLAFWAYNQNYETQAELRRTQAVRAEIAELREKLNVLRAEWAYLNRPDRLRDLANLNFDRLRLFPLSPDQFGDAEQVPYPPAVPDQPDFLASSLLAEGVQ